MPLARNVEYRIEGRKLVLEIDLDGDLGASKSGLSRLIATASGVAVKDADGLRFNVLAYRPYSKRELLNGAAPGAVQIEQER